MQPQQPYYGPPSGQPSEPQNYDFIMGPGQQKSKKIPSLGGSSMIRRLVIIVVVIGVLLILFLGIKDLLSSSSNAATSSLLSVAQDQAELNHLATTATTTPLQSSVMSADNQAFALTVEVVMPSEQTSLTTYLGQTGHKVAPTELLAKQSTSLDNELTAAAAANEYDQTFDEIMQNQLTTYQQDLSAAYKITTGTKGRALLSTDYSNAKLLYTELTSPAS